MYRSHDQLFKDLIRGFPGEFVRLVAPIQVGELSLPPVGFPSTEAFFDPPRADARRMDLLVRIDSADGEPLLLHAEFERRFRRATAARLWEYNRLARLRYDLPVYTVILYLRGGPRGLVTETHRERAVRQYRSMLAERRHRGVRTMIMTWADKMEAEWTEVGLRKGRQKGMKEVVLRLLSRRFSPLPAAVTQKVSALASAEELASLADRILEARSLEDLGLA